MASNEYLTEVEILPDSQDVEIAIPVEIPCETVETTLECDQQGKNFSRLKLKWRLSSAFLWNSFNFSNDVFCISFCLQKPKM